MSISNTLAQFVCNLRYEQLPSEIVSEAKVRIIDILAAVLAGRRTMIGQMLTGLPQEAAGTGRATILSSGKAANVLSTVLVNSAIAHCAEIDDIHPVGVTCTGAMIVPAVLGFAEMTGATGRQVIEALVAGYEVVTRVGMGVKGEELLAKGWWPSSIAGPLGVAAAASKLLRQAPEAMTHAIGIAGILAGGLLTGGAEGPSGRHFLFGRSVQNGAQASLLAGEGFTGPSEIIEDSRGLYRSLDVDVSTDRMTEKLGEEFFFPQTIQKLFACALQVQAGLKGLIEVMKENGLTSRDLKEVRAWFPPKALQLMNRPGIPPNHTAGVSYAPFLLALAAIFGDVLPEHFDRGAISAQEDRDLVDRITLLEDEFRGSHANQWPARVEVKCFDGRVLEKQVRNWSAERLEEKKETAKRKFRKFAQGSFEDRGVGRIFDAVERLDQAENIRGLIEAFCTKQSAVSSQQRTNGEIGDRDDI